MTVGRRDQEPTVSVDGLVTEPVTLGRTQLEALPGRVDDVGTIDSSFAGAAAPAASILGEASPLPAARFVTVASDDGLYTASIPLDALANNGLLIFGIEGEPLARERGGPFRLIVPDGRTLCWNVKSVAQLTVTAEQQPDSVPANPPH